MSITLLIFFLINFHFMEKNGYYRDFFHSLSSNCTIKYENFRSFDFQSDMKLQFLYPTRFMFHMKIYLITSKLTFIVNRSAIVSTLNVPPQASVKHFAYERPRPLPPSVRLSSPVQSALTLPPWHGCHCPRS